MPFYTAQVKDQDSMELTLSQMRQFLEEICLSHQEAKIEVFVYHNRGKPDIQMPDHNIPFED